MACSKQRRNSEGSTWDNLGCPSESDIIQGLFYHRIYAIGAYLDASDMSFTE